jgi:hypothetical protein
LATPGGGIEEGETDIALRQARFERTETRTHRVPMGGGRWDGQTGYYPASRLRSIYASPLREELWEGRSAGGV